MMKKNDSTSVFGPLSEKLMLNMGKAFVAVWVLSALVSATVTGVIIYVVYHFVSKFW